ncbi:MAG: murein biosynthesis integral membrane protein MurJ, partial [Gammaproteobacteria bacterium]
KLRLMPRPRWNWQDSGVRKIMRLMVPALFGSSVAQINLLLDTLIASFLITGSVSWLYFSDRLMEFPLGVFGIAIATVILPSLSRRHAEADSSTFAATLDWGMRWSILIAVPAMLALVLLPGPLLTTLFQYGEFSEHSVYMASQSLIAYGLGLPAFVLIKVLAPGFYSRQDTKTPVKVGVIAMVTNMAFNIALVFPLAHVGLALATTLSAYVNAGLLFMLLRRDGAFQAQSGWGLFGLRILLATAVMAALLFWFTPAPADWIAAGAGDRVSWMFAVVLGGSGAYLLSLLLLGVRPRQLMGRL